MYSLCKKYLWLLFIELVQYEGVPENSSGIFKKKNTVSSMKKSSRMFLLYSYDVFGETTVYLRHSRNIFVQYECVAKKFTFFSFVKCHEELLFL